MSELIDEFGPAGYGVWWIILEKIAAQMDKSERCSARYSIKKWATFCGISSKKFQKTVKFLTNLGKLTAKNCQKNSDFLIIECRNLLKFRDEYTKKSGQSPDNRRIKSEACQEQETETETETETKNKEKIYKKEKFSEAFERWWKTYPKLKGRRVGKVVTKKLFEKIPESGWNDLKIATKNYTEYAGDKPKHPERFLKNNFWKDFLKPASPSKTPRNGEKPKDGERSLAELKEAATYHEDGRITLDG